MCFSELYSSIVVRKIRSYVIVIKRLMEIQCINNFTVHRVVSLPVKNVVSKRYIVVMASFFQLSSSDSWPVKFFRPVRAAVVFRC